MTILKEFFRENDLKQKRVISTEKDSISYPSSQLMFSQELTVYDTSIALQLDSSGWSLSIISREKR